jgi:hypothetical protein
MVLVSKIALFKVDFVNGNSMRTKARTVGQVSTSLNIYMWNKIYTRLFSPWTGRGKGKSYKHFYENDYLKQLDTFEIALRLRVRLYCVSHTHLQTSSASIDTRRPIAWVLGRGQSMLLCCAILHIRYRSTAVRGILERKMGQSAT